MESETGIHTLIGKLLTSNNWSHDASRSRFDQTAKILAKLNNYSALQKPQKVVTVRSGRHHTASREKDAQLRKRAELELQELILKLRGNGPVPTGRDLLADL